MKKVVTSAWFIIFVLVCLFFLPFFIHPQSLLARNNDLAFFKDAFSFIKLNILQNHYLPLWQNYSLVGSPILGDPQNLLLYPLNYLILFFSTNTFLLVYFYLHFLICGMGGYLLGKYLKQDKFPALILTTAYTFSPLMTAHLEQGHLNMLVAFAYFPYFLLFLLKVFTRPNLKSALFLGGVSAWIFLSYPTIFIYMLLAGFILLGYLLATKKLTINVFSFVSILIFILICLPQIYGLIKFLPLTNRNLIALEDLGPNAESMQIHLKSIINYLGVGFNYYSCETVLTFGYLALILGILGWCLLKWKNKILILVIIGIGFWASMGTKTHLYRFIFFHIPFLLSLRITTRFWFILVLLTAILGANFINQKIKSQALRLIILILVFMELFYFCQNYFPAKLVETTTVSYPVIEKYLSQQPDNFRIYCPQNCINKNLSVNYTFINGYNPMLLTNFFQFATAAAGFKFGSYALVFPPYQTIVDKPQPIADLMGEIGVKYIISPYKLADQHLTLVLQEKDLILYENKLNKPRIYCKAENKLINVDPQVYLPGNIKTSLAKTCQELVISEIYFPTWSAQNSNGNKLTIEPEQNVVLKIKVNPDADGTIEISAFPKWINYLIYLSLGLSVVLMILLIYNLSPDVKSGSKDN